MSCHALELYVSTVDPNGDPVDAQARKDEAQTWVDNHDTVLNEQSEDFGAGTLEDGTNYYWGKWHFHFDEMPSALFDSVEPWLNNHFKWWRMRYHVCDHDEPVGEREGCEWSNKWESGTVPSGIPDV